MATFYRQNWPCGQTALAADLTAPADVQCKEKGERAFSQSPVVVASGKTMTQNYVGRQQQQPLRNPTVKA